jgi:hypothetical protein
MISQKQKAIRISSNLVARSVGLCNVEGVVGMVVRDKRTPT